MALQRVDLTAPYQHVEWLVEGLLPLGMLSFIGAQPGAGKTTLMAALAWQMARDEEDLEFLGRKARPGATVYVNFDSPTGDGRSIRHVLDRLQVADPAGSITDIHILEPDTQSYGLGEDELADIRRLALERGAKLIVLDSFMACFPEVNGNRTDSVMLPLMRLRDLAVETQAAVVIIDHLPKQMPGEKPGARGLMGSNSKRAQARAVHLLHALEGEEHEGRHLMRVQCQKMTFGPAPKPFVVECMHKDGGLVLAHGEIDEVVQETKTRQAQRLMHRQLTAAGPAWISRKELTEFARAETGLGLTATKGALDSLLGTLGTSVEQRTLKQAGAPLEYRLIPTEEPTKPE